MNSIATLPRIARLSESATLDELLADLRNHGLPRLTMLSKDGWYCCVKMYTNVLGAEFEVSSEFSHARPIDAARECYDRMQSALAALGQRT